MRSLLQALYPVGIIILFAAVLLVQVIPALAADAALPPAIEVFVREGCSHCEDAKTFLNELARERPGLR